MEMVQLRLCGYSRYSALHKSMYNLVRAHPAAAR